MNKSERAVLKAAMNNLMEEAADVQIMLDQIRLMYPSLGVRYGRIE